MAKYSIYNKAGTKIAEGSPKYYGQYGKPSYLEFNISSPSPIPFDVGSYVTYDRTGLTYFLYSVPEPKKQARSGEVGDSFVYQSLIFYDATKELENLIFENLVLGTSGYCFSSRESLSTFEDLDGIIARLQECADKQSDRFWEFSKVDLDDFIGYDYLADVWNEAREFPINGQSLLDACNQVTDVFTGIGWVYIFNSAMGIHKIVFGAPNIPEYLATSAGTESSPLKYGKGNGLRSLKKYLTNKDEFLTRLFAYGNDRNMPPRYYNGKTIVSADSVDIPNLMIPIADWGTSVDPDTQQTRPDAAKAYVEDNTIITKYGLIPRRVYFKDDEHGDIYPTIKGMTVKDVRDYISGGGTVDAAPGASWSDSQPLDEVLRVFPDGSNRSITQFDDGRTDSEGRAVSFQVSNGNDNSGTTSIPPAQNVSGNTGTKSISLSFEFTTNPRTTDAVLRGDFNGVLKLTQTSDAIISNATAYMVMQWKQSGSTKTTPGVYPVKMVISESGTSASYSNNILNYNQSYDYVPTPASVIDAQYIRISLAITFDYLVVTGGGTNTFTLSSSGTTTASIYTQAKESFRLILPPFGYDITSLVAVEDKVRIAMTSGKCAGREFNVKAASFTWQPTSPAPLGRANPLAVDLERTFDDSLSMLFPNSDYPIEQDDKFVILGIAMPEMYVTAAESRLLAAANSYYNLNSVPRFLYTPELDSQMFITGGGSFYLPVPGGYMWIEDDELTDEESIAILVDTVTIQEADSNIPVVSCTLRERLNVPNAT